MSFLQRLRMFGPGALVAAAIIGPGTVTTASRAGASFGFTLLWALLFSIITTIILQEMCLRLGLISRQSLGYAIHKQFNNPLLRFFALGLVFSAIIIGSAAYEAGNIAGAGLGLNALTDSTQHYWPILIGLLVATVLWHGSYKILEKFFIICISLMSLCFLLTAIIIGPPFLAILKGLFIPQLPSAATLTTVALIGTTVVPYNLFLHSSLVQQRWQSINDLSQARSDNFISLSLTGLISIAIVITAAMAFPNQTQLSNAQQMASQLEPVLGSWAKICFALGLTAAGLTSAMTAPLASAFAATGIFGQASNYTSKTFRITWITVLAIGVFCSSLNIQATEIILFAQYANGLLLPLIAGFLVFIMNQKQLLGEYRNGIWSNIGGGIVISVCVLLAVKSFGGFTS